MAKPPQLDISVIIPFKNKSKMTLDCVHSIFRFGPSLKEIILVSNNSDDSDLKDVESGIKSYSNVRLFEYNHPFNYQKMNNWAVKQSTGKYILFLNNDTELKQQSVGLIERMLTKASEPKVGIVGCLLLYGGEKLIQHAGVYLVPGGLGEHLFVAKKYAKALSAGGKTKEFPYDITKDRPLTAVTGAVNLVERKKYDEINGFDERFIICGGDVDLCIRMNKAGYQTWYLGGGYIVHKESQSRKFTPIPYNDFYWSYLSYAKGFDENSGDPFLPKVTNTPGFIKEYKS